MPLVLCVRSKIVQHPPSCLLVVTPNVSSFIAFVDFIDFIKSDLEVIFSLELTDLVQRWLLHRSLIASYN